MVGSAPASLEKPKWSPADACRKRGGEGHSDESQMETGTMLLQTEGKESCYKEVKSLVDCFFPGVLWKTELVSDEI